MNVEKIKRKKLLIILVVIMVVSFIFGIFFLSILSDDNQNLIKDSINNYFNGIYKGELAYLKSLYTVFISNFFLIIFTWIMGISIVGVFITILTLIYKSFVVGFSFCSILYTYGLKGILKGFIYIFPEVINLFIVFVVVYYAMNFSLLLFNNLFRKKEFNKRVIIIRYLKIFLFSLGVIIISSLISVFVIPNVLMVLNF